MKYLAVLWQDHYSEAGWADTDTVKPLGHLNISVGILVQENNVHVTLAQTMHKNEEVVADVIHILKINIIKREELS